MASTVHPPLPAVSHTELVLHGDREDPARRLERTVAGFLAAYKTTTRNTYAFGLKGWIAWCNEVGLDPLAAQRPHIELYARHLEQSGRARSTVAHKLNILASFYKVIAADGEIPRNPMDGVRRPSVPRTSTTKAMSQLQLARVIEVADAEGLQSRCVSHLLAFCALRASTLCSINVEHFTHVAGSMVLTILTKGDTELVLGIPPATAWHLQQLTDKRGTGPLFLNGYGNRLTRANLAVLVERWARAAGVKQRITPHSFRHSFVTLARQAHLPPEEIMAVTGHVDERMITYYDRTPALMRSSIATARIASQVLAA